MNIPEYVIGITIPAAGLSDRQMMSVVQRFRFLDKSLSALDAKLVLRVAGVHLRKPQELPHQVEKILRYRTTARVECLGPLTDLWLLNRLEVGKDLESFLWHQFKACDEVWCFTGSAARYERANRLYRYALEIAAAKPGVETKYKLIPPWVEIESEPSKKQRKGNATNGTHGKQVPRSRGAGWR